MAESLVTMMAIEFDPGAFRDEYKQAVDQIVAAKVSGGSVVEAPESEAATTVIDLMAALRASVERAKASAERAEKALKADKKDSGGGARRKAS